MDSEKMLDMIKMELKEKDAKIEELEARIEMLQKALLAKKGKINGDVEIHGQDMEDMWNQCVKQMFDEEEGAEDAVYQMATLHWNGYYCKIGSGASFGESFIGGLGEYCSEEIYYGKEDKINGI